MAPDLITTAVAGPAKTTLGRHRPAEVMDAPGPGAWAAPPPADAGGSPLAMVLRPEDEAARAWRWARRLVQSLQQIARDQRAIGRGRDGGHGNCSSRAQAPVIAELTRQVVASIGEAAASCGSYGTIRGWRHERFDALLDGLRILADLRRQR